MSLPLGSTRTRRKLLAATAATAFGTIGNMLRSGRLGSVRRAADCRLLLVAALLGVFGWGTAGVSAQGVAGANKTDQSLRSNGRVNPSTLGLEFALPLGGYPGRGGTLPFGLNYSSKLWRMNFLSRSPLTNTTQCISYYEAEFADGTAGGWTSSLGTAYVEYTGSDTFYDVRGYPSNDGDCSTNPPPISYDYKIQRIQIHLPTGESHELRKQDAPITLDTAGTCGTNNWNGWYYAADGSNLKYYEDCTAGVYYALLPDGARYDFAGSITAENIGPDHNFGRTMRLASRMLDRNGNQTIYSTPTAGHPNGSWTDTLGRVLDAPLPRAAPITAGTQPYTLPGLAGGTLNYQFVWKQLQGATAAASALTDFNQTLVCRGTSTGPPNYDGTASSSVNGLFSGYNFSVVVCPSAERLFNPVLLGAVILPDGSQYRFTYNLYGELDRIEYPTGGVEVLVHGPVLPLTLDRGPSQPLLYPTAKANRGVVNRKVYEFANAGTWQEWSYQTAYASTVGYKVTQTNPDLTRQERFLYQGKGSCPVCPGTFGFESALGGMPYEERSFSSDNQLKSQSFKYWTNTPIASGYGYNVDWHPRLYAEKSVVYEGSGSGLAATSVSEFDGDLNQRETPQQVRKTTAYDYEIFANPGTPDANAGPPTFAAPSSAAAKSAETIFLINDPNIAPATRQAYLDRNLVGLATATLIRDAANNVKAQSAINYDESDNSPAYRGNATRMRSWLDTNNTWLESRARYDAFGNVVEATDARGNVSQIRYDDNYADGINRNSAAFPTRTISAIPGGSGSTTAFETTVKYDFNTGLPTSTIDANNLETRLEYNDPLLRPTRMQHYFGGLPVGAATETVYGAGTSDTTRFVKSRTQIDETRWKEGFSWYDGLGRAIKMQSVNASGDVFTKTLYDNIGRVSKTSHPYRGATTTDNQLEWTEVQYDTAGRAWKTITPDGAAVQTAYALATTGDTIGTAITVTDQALKQRRSITNALGQLKRVDEPTDTNGTNGLGAIDIPNQPTYYAYNTLNNLTTVQQNGTSPAQCGTNITTCSQTRSFVYDSLSRLRSATNPEMGTTPTNGTITYQYDNNGNLTKKIDARLVEINYLYDALNRVTSRSYTAPANLPNYQAAPPVNYFYDNLPNAKGKLTKASSTTSTTEYTAFDALGRVSAHQQTTDGQVYNTAYVYNLSGAMTEETYPSTRVVKNVLNNDGYLALVQSKKNGNAGYFNYAKSFSYTAAGAVSSMQLGNGKWESATFNSRLQLTQIALGAVQNGTDKLKLNFDYGTTANNGNVLSQTITTPSETHGNTTYPAFVAAQVYNYDSLNRLKSAEETSPTQPGWKQTFLYDRFGNRNFDTANGNTTTLPLGCATAVCNPQVDPATNKLIGYVFDNAGNTKTDANGQMFVYDAENKQVEVIQNSVSIGKYYYDGNGKRVKKVVPSTGETTVFVYDASGKMVAEYSTVASSTPQVSYLTSDGLGSPRINTDANGVVISRHDYLPFGEEVQRTSYGADANRKQFTGYEKDAETNLGFAQARMYNSQFGRFTTVDPYGGSGFTRIPQSWNRYSYCLNRPYTFKDPSGMIWLTNDNGANNIWVNDKYYKKHEKDYEGYDVANGAVMKLKGTIGFGNKYIEQIGTYVSLNANGTITSVPDPTLNIIADKDDNDANMTAALGTLSVKDLDPSLHGPPGGSSQYGPTTRYYNSDGRAYVDVDYANNHPEVGNPHIHWWDWDKGQIPERGDPEPVPGWWGTEGTTEDGVEVKSPFARKIFDYPPRINSRPLVPSGQGFPLGSPVVAPITQPAPAWVPAFP